MSSSISSHLPTNCWNTQLNLYKPARQIKHIVHIIATEAFAAIRHVLPCAVSWWIKEYFSKEITSRSFQLTIDKTQSIAKLFLYEPLSIKENEDCTPLLCIPGDYGHPYSLDHLAQIAQNMHRGPVFSLYIPKLHDEDHFMEQAAFIEKVIDAIKKMVEAKGGVFRGILAVGHSKGAMLLVERQFYSETPSQILRTFAVAGPLKNEQNCFTEPLKSIFNDLGQKIKHHPERKFFQVIPKNDWTAPFEAMAIRPDEHCYLVPGMHLSGLYSQETKNLFKHFLTLSA